jgi:hypothetical protein
LYSFRNREYSPTLGRWIQPDPSGFAGQDVNFARFVNNNPVRNNDAFGLQAAPPPPRGLTIGDVIGAGLAGSIAIGGKLGLLPKGPPAPPALPAPPAGAGGGGPLGNVCQGKQVLTLDKVKVTKITFGKAELLRWPSDLDVSDFSALAGTSVTDTADYWKAIRGANDQLHTILVKVVPDDPFTRDGYSSEIWPDGTLLECEKILDSKKDLGVVKKDVPVDIYIDVRKQSDNQMRTIKLASTFSVEGQMYSYDLRRTLKDPVERRR